MAKGKVKEEISKELILNRLSEEQIYSYYLGIDVEEDRKYHTPFRKEDTPSLSFKTLPSGLHFKDYGDDTYQGGCIDFVMQLFNLSFYEALKKISLDFDLGPSILDDRKEYQRVINERTHEPRKETIIQVVSRPFTRLDKQYWADYHISIEELKSNSVYSVKKLFLNGEACATDEMVFGYLMGEKWKIYSPYADKKRKWMTNAPIDWVWGIDKVVSPTPRCFITKSKKDQMILSKFLPCVIATQNESRDALPSKHIDFLKSNCEDIIINFDNDEVGVKASKGYNKHGFKWVNCPKGYLSPNGDQVKDFADLARHYGLETVINYFKSKNLV